MQMNNNFAIAGGIIVTSDVRKQSVAAASRMQKRKSEAFNEG